MATETAAISVLVSRTLDDIGYSQQTVNLRQRYFELSPDSVGSKAEGLTSHWESDYDFMSTHGNILCACNHSLYNHIENLTVLQMDRSDVAPGYTKLMCTQLATVHCMHASMVETEIGNMYLSSDVWRNLHNYYHPDYRVLEVREQPAQGPSNPLSFHIPGVSAPPIHTDYVDAIICDCPEILQSWMNRPRMHDWPSAEIIQEISSLEAHVVPVGNKGSPLKFLEWRICFTRAEIRLIHSFNDCQTKLVVLLKMIAKSSLKPVCKEMTTYIMKNIVLWMAELFPVDYFTPENLFQALKSALMFLRECLVARCLPSYMIPERNLLANRLGRRGRLRLTARDRLCAMIDILLNEDTRMLLRCERIRKSWNILLISPDLFYLSTMNHRTEAYLLSSYMNGELNIQEMSDLLNPIISDLIRNGEMEEFKQFLSSGFEVLMSTMK